MPGTPSEPDQSALCAAAAGGDAGAAERLFVLHHARFLGLAKRKIGADWQGKIEPEDVLQDAYAAAWATITKFEHRGEDSFFRWVARIIDERFIDRVRGVRRKKRDTAREAARPAGSRMETLLARLEAEQAGASVIARRRDAGAAVLAALATLPADYRDVIQRVYLDEQPIAEAAGAMGRSEDAARRLAGRALAALRLGLGRASRWLTAS